MVWVSCSCGYLRLTPFLHCIQASEGSITHASIFESRILARLPSGEASCEEVELHDQKDLKNVGGLGILLMLLLIGGLGGVHGSFANSDPILFNAIIGVAPGGSQQHQDSPY